MNKVKRSLKLLKVAGTLLRREKRLLWFPLISAGLMLLAAGFFLLPVVLYPTGHSYWSAAHWHTVAGEFVRPMDLNQYSGGAPAFYCSIGAGNSPRHGFVLTLLDQRWFAPLMVVLYFCAMAAGTFTNVAFYHEIMQALNGRPVSLRRGLRLAASRWRAILAWSLFAGLVGYIIQTLERRLGVLSRWIIGVLGIMWSAASIFIIPTLVRTPETADPVKLLRHSAATLKRTWGELVLGMAGVELVLYAVWGMLLLLSLFLWILAIPIVDGRFGGVPLDQRLFVILLYAAGFGFATLTPFVWLSKAVDSIYRCALYVYATEGVVPGCFDQELLDSAWEVK